MTTKADLYSVNLKLARARKHIEDLEKEIDGFMKMDPFDLRTTSTDGGKTYLTTITTVMPPYRHWSAIVGDCVHNMRSALDHLAWQLVVASGNRPRGGPGGTQFPIKRERPRDAAGRPAFPRVQGNVRRRYGAILNAVQPYQRRGDLGADQHPLQRLAEFSNTDKHRELVLVAFAPTLATVGVPPGVPEPWVIHLAATLSDGEVVAMVGFPSPQPGLDIDLDVRIEVCLEESNSQVGKLPIATSATQTLLDLFGYVCWIVEDRFEPIL